MTRYPRTKFYWCDRCGERVTVRRGAKFGPRGAGYHYLADPHICPRTCSYCGATYTITTGGRGTTDLHTCPGREAAWETARQATRAMLRTLNRAVRGGKR